jgi:hypothetical protein
MTLKITPEDLQALKSAVTPLDSPARRERYLANDFFNAARCIDKDKRYRWDLLWESGLLIASRATGPGVLGLYAYMNDDHIDSALRHLVPPLPANEPATA